jgi:hypothetical protein
MFNQTYFPPFSHFNEQVEQVVAVQVLQVEDLPSPPTPKGENLRLADRAPQPGQTGFFPSLELLVRTSKTRPHFPHSNSYIGIFGPLQGKNFNGSTVRSAWIMRK